MFKVGEKFVRVECGQEVEYEIVRIDKEDAEYPYECFSVDTLKEADEIAETEGTTREDVLYYGDYDFLDERSCFSEKDVACCKHKAAIKEKELDVEFYKDMAMSLIVAIDQNVCEFNEKMHVFRETGITPEEFRKLGYNSIACQLEDTEE